MYLQEAKKCCKIIDEIMLFFMRSGSKDIDIKYTFKEHNITLYFEIKDCKEESFNRFNKKLSAHHEMQYEGFAWELMGDGDFDELEIVGGLIDELQTDYHEGTLSIRMVRNFE